MSTTRGGRSNRRTEFEERRKNRAKGIELFNVVQSKLLTLLDQETKDLHQLAQLNADCEGAIALMKQSHEHNPLQVKNEGVA